MIRFAILFYLKAFTLIELLVVIAIIGILAILAVVALQQARQNARDSKRMADIKQVHTALELFFNENSRYPTAEEWSSIDGDGVLHLAYLAKTDGTGICPAGFRVPTEAEMNTERLSWNSNDRAGAFASPLKLPVAGFRDYTNGSLSNVGVVGSCWLGTADGTNSRSLYFNSSNADVGSGNRASGFLVSCLKD